MTYSTFIKVILISSCCFFNRSTDSSNSAIQLAESPGSSEDYIYYSEASSSNSDTPVQNVLSNRSLRPGWYLVNSSLDNHLKISDSNTKSTVTIAPGKKVFVEEAHLINPLHATHVAAIDDPVMSNSSMVIRGSIGLEQISKHVHCPVVGMQKIGVQKNNPPTQFIATERCWIVCNKCEETIYALWIREVDGEQYPISDSFRIERDSFLPMYDCSIASNDKAISLVLQPAKSFNSQVPNQFLSIPHQELLKHKEITIGKKKSPILLKDVLKNKEIAINSSLLLVPQEHIISIINTTDDHLVYYVMRNNEISQTEHLSPQARAVIVLFSDKHSTGTIFFSTDPESAIKNGTFPPKARVANRSRTSMSREDVPHKRILYMVKTSEGTHELERLPRNQSLFCHTLLTLFPAQKGFRPAALCYLEREQGIFKLPLSLSEEILTPKLIKTRITELPREKEFFTKRKAVVQKGIEKFIAEDIFSKSPSPKIPITAFCSTGGGYRAMIATTGALEGAEEVGILDCIMYMCGLSGSSWSILPLVASGRTKVKEFAADLKKRVNNTTHQNGIVKLTGYDTMRQLLCNVVKSAVYEKRALIQSRFNQFPGLIGMYGHAIAEDLLEGISIDGKDEHEITLSDLQKNLDKAEYPLPIAVAIESDKDTSKDGSWFEFTPYYCGTSSHLTWGDEGFHAEGFHIESRYFGSLFNGGQILQVRPEYPLAEFMGICGSAFALSSHDLKYQRKTGTLDVSETIFSYLGQMVSKVGKDLKHLVESTFPSIETETIVPDERLAAGQVPNFIYGSRLHPLGNKKTLSLVDGGLRTVGNNTHNFATVPALARRAEILILCDCPQDPSSDKYAHLLAAEAEAKALGYKFPKITGDVLKRCDRAHASVLIYEEDPEVPIVLYMKVKLPTDIQAAGFIETKNFSYSEKEYELLKNAGKQIMTSPQTISNIRLALKKLIERKHVPRIPLNPRNVTERDAITPEKLVNDLNDSTSSSSSGSSSDDELIARLLPTGMPQRVEVPRAPELKNLRNIFRRRRYVGGSLYSGVTSDNVTNDTHSSEELLEALRRSLIRHDAPKASASTSKHSNDDDDDGDQI